MINRWFYNNFLIDNYQEIGSTNDLIVEMAINDNSIDNYVICAQKQTNGHGRSGRDWQSPEGNLYFSLLIRPNSSIKDYSLLSFIAAIAISNAIIGLTNSQVNLEHKWPNDILLHGKKIAGILLKSDKSKQGLEFVVIGVGINILSNPKQTNFPSGNIKEELNIDINKEELLKLFLDNFSIFYQKFVEFGFAPIRNLWIKRAFKLNEEINVNLSNKRITAIFRDLNNSGNLILELDNGDVEAVSSAEIYQ